MVCEAPDTSVRQSLSYADRTELKTACVYIFGLEVFTHCIVILYNDITQHI